MSMVPGDWRTGSDRSCSNELDTWRIRSPRKACKLPSKSARGRFNLGRARRLRGRGGHVFEVRGRRAATAPGDDTLDDGYEVISSLIKHKNGVEENDASENHPSSRKQEQEEILILNQTGYFFS